MNKRVEFEEDVFNTKKKIKKSSMTDFLISCGIVKNRTQASVVLLLCAILFLVSAVYIGSSTLHKKQLPYQPNPDSLLNTTK